VPTHLAELAEVLSTPAPRGTVVALHHAPVPPPSPLLGYFALTRSSRAALGEVIADTDVRLVLAGHHHLAQSATLAGVPVAVGGSTAIRTDPLAPTGHERTHAGGSVQLVDFYPNAAVVSVIPVDGAPEAFDLDPAGCAEVIAAHPIAWAGP
jgi:3',5'-cyclic AMP phosphodiesterase CpdA